MDYATEFAAIRDESNHLAQDTRRLSWALARTVPASIERAIKARFDTLVQSDHLARHLPVSEQDRIQNEMFAEESAARQLAASVLRHRVEPRAEALENRRQNYIRQRRADTALSFPRALDGFRSVDMVALAMLREQRRGLVERAGPDELLQLAQAAFSTQDAVGFVDFGLVAERVSRGGLSRTEDDPPIVKELAQFVEGIIDLRVEPLGLLDVVGENVREAQKAIGRAELVRVLPINAEHDVRAQAAFERAAAEFDEETAAAQ